MFMIAWTFLGFRYINVRFKFSQVVDYLKTTDSSLDWRLISSQFYFPTLSLGKYLYTFSGTIHIKVDV